MAKKMNKNPYLLLCLIMAAVALAALMPNITYGLQGMSSYMNEFIGGSEHILPPGSSGENKPDSRDRPGSPAGLNRPGIPERPDEPEEPMVTIDEQNVPFAKTDPADPGSVPKTGAETDTGFWLLMLAASAMTMRQALFFGKKPDAPDNGCQIKY